MEENLELLARKLLDWYDQNKRSLPWRDQNNAYYTWVSEIMLQQTRVEAVKPYFERFISQLPTLRHLAEAQEEKLYKLWEGLGYYSRVRNMQEAARDVCSRFGGELPADYDQLLSLKGIGAYTAGAIASIAYQLPVPAVDGNVYRVYMRLTADKSPITEGAVQRRVAKEISSWIPAERPGDFNQALMELGATLCGPNGAPSCGQCPLSIACRAYAQNNPLDYPVKPSKKPRRIEKHTLLIVQDGEASLVHKRPKKGLLAGLYEPLNLDGELSKKEALKAVCDLGLEPIQITALQGSKHIFSHIEWHMIAYQIRISAFHDLKDPSLVFAERESFQEHFPMPSAFSAYQRYLGRERS